MVSWIGGSFRLSWAVGWGRVKVNFSERCSGDDFISRVVQVRIIMQKTIQEQLRKNENNVKGELPWESSSEPA